MIRSAKTNGADEKSDAGRNKKCVRERCTPERNNMILADKIINERKKNGWSQEELADKLSVSRQSVSKWEGAQSIPDISKILQMAELFGVSTDYLLKDDIEAVGNDGELTVSEESVPPRRKVSMEEANAYIDTQKRVIPRIANGVSLCITCSVVLIFLAGLSGCGFVSDALAVGVGLGVLFAFIAIAVFIFIKCDAETKQYEYLENEDIETEYGVIGLVKEKKKAFEQKTTNYTVIGTILFICCSIPLIISTLVGAPDWIVVGMVSLLLILVAVGVNLVIRVSGMNESYDKLLQEGEYSDKGKERRKKIGPFVSLYWGLATAIFLGYSFLTGRWDISWVVWPIAGVLFWPYKMIIKIVKHVED